MRYSGVQKAMSRFVLKWATYIVMEYCQKVINRHTLRTLDDLLLFYDSDLPMQLRIVALCDVAEGRFAIPS